MKRQRWDADGSHNIYGPFYKKTAGTSFKASKNFQNLSNSSLEAPKNF